MKKFFSNEDIVRYYDQTEVHYRLFWKLEESMGLHYGVWNEHTKKVQEAILNTNHQLMQMGHITSADKVLDAGCGIGGSSVYVAKQTGCEVTGITLSAKQVATATAYAQKAGLQQVRFLERDYTQTGFDAASFDVVWAIESMQTATDKWLFFKEAARVLKPGGRVLIADIFKPYPYDVTKQKDMLMMLNGWAMSDAVMIEELKAMAEKAGLRLTADRNVTREVKKSAVLLYYSGLLGMVGTKLYNLYRKATYFSRIHYKTGIGQYRAYKKKLWEYHLLVLEKV